MAEDDQVNREVVVHYLQTEGYQTIEARDGVAALRRAREGADLAVLDLGLPAIDGLNVIRSLRSERNMLPIIVLSARVDEVDRVVAFEAGADDYVPKPFLPREVVCRVRALLRRATPDALRTDRTTRVGPLEIDEAARELRIDGIRVNLRPREFALVALLATHPGIAMPRRQLIEHVWGADYDGDERTVDGHITRIRRQLSLFPQIACNIESIYGYGYKFAIA
ncbi:MAG: response regulator transcription factor [Vulcanimicrobiaceae bacterium]